MNEANTNQEAQAEQPLEPIDATIAYLAALIQSLETERNKEAEQAKIPADIPRFVTYR
jgi:hypothetical protein